MHQGHSRVGLCWLLHPAYGNAAKVPTPSTLISRGSAQKLVTWQSFNSCYSFPLSITAPPPQQPGLPVSPAARSELHLIPSSRHLSFLVASLCSSLGTSLLNSPLPPSAPSLQLGDAPQQCADGQQQSTLQQCPTHSSEGSTSQPWCAKCGRPGYRFLGCCTDLWSGTTAFKIRSEAVLLLFQPHFISFSPNRAALSSQESLLQLPSRPAPQIFAPRDNTNTSWL